MATDRRAQPSPSAEVSSQFRQQVPPGTTPQTPAGSVCRSFCLRSSFQASTSPYPWYHLSSPRGLPTQPGKAPLKEEEKKKRHNNSQKNKQKRKKEKSPVRKSVIIGRYVSKKYLPPGLSLARGQPGRIEPRGPRGGDGREAIERRNHAIVSRLPGGDAGDSGSRDGDRGCVCGSVFFRGW